VKATLTYHSLDDSGSAISMTPRAFDRHLAWLASGRVRVLTLDQLAVHPDDADDAVAVTFDDGFLNVRPAVERLLAHGLPTTIFVVSGHVGLTNRWGGQSHPGIPTFPLLGWNDLEFLTARGARIEAHTRSHAVLPRLSRSALDDELHGCQDDLFARLGTRSTHLAYPYGEVDDVVESRAASCFRFAHTTAFRCLTAADAKLRLPRLDMYYFQRPGSIDAWGTRAFARRVAWCAARRQLRARIVGSSAPKVPSSQAAR
jgi:peptidoglycan/xylan/chitin deacetylase (PgdA/CDA1 family)